MQFVLTVPNVQPAKVGKTAKVLATFEGRIPELCQKLEKRYGEAPPFSNPTSARNDHTAVPMRVGLPFGKKAIDIACSGYQTVALFDDGEVMRCNFPPMTLPSLRGAFKLVAAAPKGHEASAHLIAAVLPSANVIVQELSLDGKGRVKRVPSAVTLEPKDRIVDIDWDIGNSQLIGLTTVGKVHTWSVTFDGERGLQLDSHSAQHASSDTATKWMSCESPPMQQISCSDGRFAFSTAPNDAVPSTS